MKILIFGWHILSMVCIGLWFTSIFFPQLGDRMMFFIFAMICDIKADVAELREAVL